MFLLPERDIIENVIMITDIQGVGNKVIDHKKGFGGSEYERAILFRTGAEGVDERSQDDHTKVDESATGSFS